MFLPSGSPTRRPSRLAAVIFPAPIWAFRVWYEGRKAMLPLGVPADHGGESGGDARRYVVGLQVAIAEFRAGQQRGAQRRVVAIIAARRQHQILQGAAALREHQTPDRGQGVAGVAPAEALDDDRMIARSGCRPGQFGHLVDAGRGRIWYHLIEQHAAHASLGEARLQACGQPVLAAEGIADDHRPAAERARRRAGLGETPATEQDAGTGAEGEGVHSVFLGGLLIV
jgi:hypothetical protein